MKCYVDSSVILQYLLTDSMDFERVRGFDDVGSSELTDIECRRVLHRYRLDGSITDSQLEEALTCFVELSAGLRLFEMTAAVKRRAAEAFPTVIGTLDAIHISTARLWADQGVEPLVLFTFDHQMRVCAGAMGLHTI